MSTTQFPRDVDRIIRQAIRERRLIRFRLDGHDRIAEPHDYGIKSGAVHLLVYQVAGGSKSGRLPDWRWIRLARASDFELLEQRFDGQRTSAPDRHTAWQQLFLRVDPPAP
ncbi:MAG TPA: hypothetical protein VK698_36430 [Kofleriaceae bacterium]|nr:hypothetical protein [Kofleriaceae bacterium]